MSAGREIDPVWVAGLVAVARIGLGTALFLAPRRLVGAVLREAGPSEEAVAALRMFAGRDVALGLGALVAARRDPRSVRAWVEAGIVADASDAFAFARLHTMAPLPRWSGLALATGAAVMGLVGRRRMPSSFPAVGDRRAANRTPLDQP